MPPVSDFVMFPGSDLFPFQFPQDLSALFPRLSFATAGIQTVL